MARCLDAVFRSYSIIFFTDNRWIGMVLLLATFLAPVYGLFGLAGLLVALGAAHLLGFDRKTIQSGAYTFNSLLTCMALAYLGHFQWDLSWRDGLDIEAIQVVRILALVVCFSLVAFIVTVFLSHLLQFHFGLPAMSLPFVVSAALLFFLFYSFTRTPIASVEPDFLVPAIPNLSPAVQTFLESFGAIFFLPNASIGLIILACLLASSRLMVIYGAAAFAAGMGFLMLFGYQVTSANLAWLGFNFLFCGMVLGGVFFVPCRASIPVAMVSAFFCAALAIAFRSFLWNFNIPPLALPFNLVVLTIVYSLRLRSDVRWLFPNPFSDGTPELNFWRFHSQRVRFPDATEPSLRPPFSGERVITQGFAGDITHVGDYQHAFDFEVIDEKGRQHSGSGDSLADFFTFGSEVLSPADGTVVHVVDHVKDNPVGRNNLVENWGNLVVIRLDSGASLQISHFKHKGVTVHEGQRVTAGGLLGYCGNSGRSPVPHLHLQVQQAAVIGSPTLQFGLRNFVRVDGEDRVFYHHGRPAEGDRIRSLDVDPVIATAFRELPGIYCYELSDKGRETVTCRIDATGNHVFESDAGALLTARIIDDVFHCLEYQGPHDSVLALFRLGLGRVPFSSLENLHWTDQASARPHMGAVRRFGLELAAPFAGFAAIRTRSHFESVSDTEIRIVTKLTEPQGGGPEQLSLTLTPGRGVTRISAGTTTARLT